MGLTMAAIILWRTQARPTAAHLARLLGFGVHLVPSTVALQMSNYLNPIMLRWLLPGDPLTALAQVGLFSVGQKVGVVVNRFLTVPFNAFWRPRRMELVVQDNVQTRHILARMCTYSTVVTCQLALLVSVAAEDLIQAAAGSELCQCLSRGALDCRGLRRVRFGASFCHGHALRA